MTGPADRAAGWAARLLALDPRGLGGVVLRGAPGPLREMLLDALRGLLPRAAPWLRCPLQVDDRSLLGGADLALSLAAGRTVVQPGLVERARGGVLVLPMAERAGAALAGRLAQALDEGGFLLVALDEGQGADEGLAACLAERLGLCLDGRVLDAGWPAPPPGDRLSEVRERWRQMRFDDPTAQALDACAAALGIGGLRAPWQAWRAASAVAAWQGHAQVTQEDAELAARLVLAPRARAVPSSGDSANAPPDEAKEAADAGRELPSTPPEADPADARDAPSSDTAAEPDERPAQPLDERLIAAAQAAMPADLLALLASGVGPRRGASGGRQGQATRAATAGRPLPSRRGSPRGAQRLDLIATLRAALPWQGVRAQERMRQSLPPAASRWQIRRDDLHVRRHQRPAQTTTIFVVDASGSQALHRLAEAKGAVELLLADCYVRRDQVALVAFRGAGAEVLLPPTRSLVRARRALTDLPGGGGTPLAAGIEAGWRLAAALQSREGVRAQLVFLTDGRANVDRQGQGGRARAMADARQMARQFGGSGMTSLLIDTSVRPQPESAELARLMRARYLALPQARPQALHQAVTAML
ncbi:magnesium chelatase subunit D [uncultured Pseudacidovorax sp.]|uniref:magnesium chelatase subunit D n=1 Tax=uncultured Pseudacidovorax sp. TaxID=679313 RepID=UPI0025E0992C|nr:magnesium chelatase subunit D [uncultured Pseudacidovorax sp.]